MDHTGLPDFFIWLYVGHSKRFRVGPTLFSFFLNWCRYFKLTNVVSFFLTLGRSLKWLYNGLTLCHFCLTLVLVWVWKNDFISGVVLQNDFMLARRCVIFVLTLCQRISKKSGKKWHKVCLFSIQKSPTYCQKNHRHCDSRH
jgi:hypothetical protein